jgi:serpin B
MRLVGMNRPTAPLAAVLSLVLLSSAGCGIVSPAGEIALARANVPRAATSAGDAAAAADGINAFGLELYRLVAAGGSNVVISPASIALALAMARAGARGTTAAEMDVVLHDVASDPHAAWMNALDQALAARSGTFTDENGQDARVTLRIANAPFAQDGMPLEQAYLAALASRFGAGLRLVDYIGQTEAARKLINGWVDDQTEHRIPQLLDPGILTSLTRLTLVNAIYLKAAWQYPFDPDATESAAFTRLDGTTVSVPTMSLSASLPYASGAGWQAVELPYVGDALAMTLILPDDLASFEKSLTAASLDEIVGSLGGRSVSLTMPRFGIETRARLAGLLTALGMPTAFDPDRADFSGITTAERLVISDVIHQANIDVDEKGTEAAAATAVVLRATAAPAEPVTVHLDRPFLFALRDVPTGTVLFLGRVSDPSVGR